MEPLKTVVFPWGGGGNHLIHLMSLDSSFDWIFEQVFKIEIPTIENKLNCIKKTIYPNTRTWHNWLKIEWTYRKDYVQVVQMLHEFYEWEDRSDPDHPKSNIPQGSRILFFEFDNAETVLNHYMHVNLGLNNKTPLQFTQMFDEWQQEISAIKSRQLDSCKFINGELLHGTVLDREFYEECCDWFGFEKFYEQACEIHDAWIKCRRRSARDFHAYFTGTEFNQYLEKMKKFGDMSV